MRGRWPSSNRDCTREAASNIFSAFSILCDLLLCGPAAQVSVDSASNATLSSGMCGSPCHAVPAQLKHVSVEATVIYKLKATVTITCNRILNASNEEGLKEFQDALPSRVTIPRQ